MDIVNMNELIDRSETLRRTLLREYEDLNRDPHAKPLFVDDVNVLLTDVKYQYTMSNGAERSILYNIARTCCVDLQTMLGVTTPEDRLPIPQPASLPRRQPYTELQFTSYIRTLARRIADDHATYHPNMGPDSNRDWHDAEIYLARDVLIGTIRLDTALGSQSYWRLENIWLNEVVQLGAYHEWEKRGRPMDSAHEKDDYYAECARCIQLLVNPGLKVPLERFEDPKTYLLTRFMQNGTKIDVCHEMVRQLIDRKIEKVRRGRSVVESNMQEHVVEYVMGYYNHIIAAIEGAHTCDAEAVINAFRRSQAHESKSSIINAFEAAIAIYFLDTTLYSSYGEHLFLVLEYFNQVPRG